MPALRPSISRGPAAVAGAVIVAAALGYAIHHLGPLQDHAVEQIVVALAVVMLLAALPATAATSQVPLPQVVVAAPERHHVRALGRADLRFTAALHVESLPHGFFTRLGSGFLREYHRTFIDSPHAVGCVATVSDVPVGMLLGVVRPGAHARWVLRHRGVRLAAFGAWRLALRPRLAFRFLRRRAGRYLNGWKRNRRADGQLPKSEGESAVLSHIAVLPGARRTGSGRLLVEAFIDACRAQDVPRATLVTLDSPQGAGTFYAELGWRAAGVRTTPDGHRLREWVRFTGEGAR
jgi:GNAT superfamily N-acetyltransferase